MQVKSRVLTLVFVAVVCVSTFAQDKASSGDAKPLIGTWKLAIVLPGGVDTSSTLTLQKTDEGLKAFLQSEGSTNSLKDVIVSGDSFSGAFAETDASGQSIYGRIAGKLEGDKLTGRIAYETPIKRSFTFTGTRTVDAQISTAKANLDKSQFESVTPNRVKLFPGRYENKLITFTGWIGEIRKHDNNFFLFFKSETGEYFSAVPSSDGFSFVLIDSMADELLQRYENEGVTTTKLLAANLYGKLTSYLNMPNLPLQYRKKQYAFVVARIEVLGLNGRPIWWLEVADTKALLNQ